MTNVNSTHWLWTSSDLDIGLASLLVPQGIAKNSIETRDRRLRLKPQLVQHTDYMVEKT